MIGCFSGVSDLPAALGFGGASMQVLARLGVATCHIPGAMRPI